MANRPRADRLAGDSSRFLDTAGLEAAYGRCRPAPADHGRVRLLVVRLEDTARATPAACRLTLEEGLEGDAWSRRPPRDINAQVSVMRHEVAELIANGQPLTLFGDNVFVDLNISGDNLPPGTRLRVGEALVAVTPQPHIGCSKFKARFGHDALRFVNHHGRRAHNLRGVLWHVLEPGRVAVGDTVEIVARPR